MSLLDYLDRPHHPDLSDTQPIEPIDETLIEPVSPFEAGRMPVMAALGRIPPLVDEGEAGIETRSLWRRECQEACSLGWIIVERLKPNTVYEVMIREV